MFNLPAVGSKARELMGDVAHVAEVLAPANRSKVLRLDQAICQGRRVMADADKAVRSVAYICQHSTTGRFVLISIGRKGGWRKEWDFGPA